MNGDSHLVYTLCGDGELQEGQIWEAIQFIAHRRLDRLVLIVDENKRQLDGYTKDVCNPFCLKDKFQSFGLDSFEVDGHDVQEIHQGLVKAKQSGRPTAVILHTIKGHGCNFAEIDGFNHYMIITHEMAQSAIAGIDAELEKIDESPD